MENNDLSYWRANDRVTLIQAALLIVGADPQEWSDEELWASNAPNGFMPIYQALLDEVNSEMPIVLPYGDRPERGFYEWRDGYGCTAKMDDLRQWVKYKGIRSSFFDSDLSAILHEGKAEKSRLYSTPLIQIQRKAIANFFEPRRDVDAKKPEVVEWIKQQMVKAGITESDNIAQAIFTIIKPENHDPRKRRG